MLTYANGQERVLLTVYKDDIDKGYISKDYHKDFDTLKSHKGFRNRVQISIRHYLPMNGDWDSLPEVKSWFTNYIDQHPTLLYFFASEATYFIMKCLTYGNDTLANELEKNPVFNKAISQSLMYCQNQNEQEEFVNKIGKNSGWVRV